MYFFLILSGLFFLQCKTAKMTKLSMSDTVQLNKGEVNAVFLAINHVDILKINGTEFYHYFLIILTRNPKQLEERFKERTALFYLTETRDSSENQVIYFDSEIWRENPLWETTISASSECAYDTTKKKLGNLIKVPNFDRVDNNKSGKRVFVKKIVSNDLANIERILEFEEKYDDSLKYGLIPEVKKQRYNSNSFTRGVLEYANLMNHLKIPSCFKSPGISKAIKI